MREGSTSGTVRASEARAETSERIEACALDAVRAVLGVGPPTDGGWVSVMATDDALASATTAGP
jgi:hypothetical protein